MISRLSGTLREVHKNLAYIEVGPFWYEVLLPANVVARLPAPGETCVLHTLYYLEGAAMGTVSYQRLIGFIEPLERDFFQLFTSVSGLGIRSALQGMTVPVSQIALAIERGDERTLKALPKIGPKTAKKIIADLQGKMGKFAMLREQVTTDAARTGAPAATRSPQAEMIEEAEYILTQQLHYGHSDATRLIERALQSTPSPETSEALLQLVFKLQGQ